MLFKFPFPLLSEKKKNPVQIRQHNTVERTPDLNLELVNDLGKVSSPLWLFNYLSVKVSIGSFGLCSRLHS